MWILHNEAGCLWWKNKRPEGRNIATGAKYRPWMKGFVRYDSGLWPGNMIGIYSNIGFGLGQGLMGFTEWDLILWWWRQNKIDPPACDELSRGEADHKYSVFNLQYGLSGLGLFQTEFFDPWPQSAGGQPQYGRSAVPALNLPVRRF